MSKVMSKIDHPFVIKLVNTDQDKQSVFMLLRLVQGGELFNVMHNDDRDCIPESEVKFYTACILEGLAYMHRRRILYRDLKPENGENEKQIHPMLMLKSANIFPLCSSH
jgi:serine/threonine protein kinase